DERAVKDLADAVFTQFAGAEFSNALSDMKNRIASAEVGYRRDNKGGVSERKLVNSLNHLSRQIGAPDFAQVSMAQLRYLRVNLAGAYPNLISQPSARQFGKSGLTTEMSPLEAATLTMLLATQKLSNEDFQVSPQEWAQKRYQKDVEKWEAHRNGAAAPARTAARSRASLENTKGKELKKI